MDTPTPLCLTCLFLLSLILSAGWREAEGSGHHHHWSHRTGSHMFGFRPTKLFVFGDSYADTGNTRKWQSGAWRIPYGITFPGRPAGRFSDGLVSTDFLAKLVGIKSPIPYKFIRKMGDWHKVLRNGVNFAYGGTGVFDTAAAGPNMTTQIDQFQRLLHDGAFAPADLLSSAALVSIAGNDYFAFLQRNPSLKGIENFIRDVVNQMAVDLKRIRSLGVKKIAVGDLQPVGCLPRLASLQRCNDTLNSFATFHNTLLKQAVAKLNNETKDSTFVTIDLYDAFMAVFKAGRSSRFQNPLAECCAGVSSNYRCGDIAETGEIKYTVCRNPQASFFWDEVHPTQAGWSAVYAAVQSNHKKLA